MRSFVYLTIAPLFFFLMKIAISFGDACGISAELILKLFADDAFRERATFIVYGSSKVLNIHRKTLGINRFNFTPIRVVEDAQRGKLNLIECMTLDEHIEVGVPSAAAGRAALQALDASIADLKRGAVHALVTLPLDKATVAANLPNFTGHTEYLAAAFDCTESLMFMADENLKVGLATNHVPLREVAAKLTTKGIVRKLQMMHDSLKIDFARQRPLIAVLGLNPHAGDNGLLGNEEQNVIQKALDEAQKLGIMAVGAFPADGFFASGAYRKYQALLAMYHDQGLIPFKVLSGYGGVNFTAGLPIVRTSPDHGTAYDIAGKGVADVSSFRNAIYMAIDVARNRRELAPLAANTLPFKKLQREREHD